MFTDDIASLQQEYKNKSSIKIPEDATYKVPSKAGYEQILTKWKKDTYKYESRWHTKTPGAPESQRNTWVINRIKPGSGEIKPMTEFLIGDEWIPGYRWYDAISARNAGIATKEQMDLLDKGHWKE